MLLEKDTELNPLPSSRQGWYTRAKILGWNFRITKITWISISREAPPDPQILNPHVRFVSPAVISRICAFSAGVLTRRRIRLLQPDEEFRFDSGTAISNIPSLASVPEARPPSPPSSHTRRSVKISEIDDPFGDSQMSGPNMV